MEKYPKLAVGHDGMENKRCPGFVDWICRFELTGPIIAESHSSIDFSEFKPYCYLSLGACPWSKAEVLNRYRMLTKYIPRQYKIVIGLGELLREKDLEIDDDRVIVFEKAPQLEAIRHAEFVVCHGGCQTVHEALHFGKPVIGIPYHAELSEMVNSVEINNAGARISPGRLCEQAVVEAVERVTSDEVLGKARKLSMAFQPLDAQQSILEGLTRARR